MSKDLRLNIFIGILWLISIFSFLEIVPVSLSFCLISLCITYFIILIFRIHLFTNLLLYLISLAPIFGAINFFNSNILFSDIFLVFSILIFFFRKMYPSNSLFYYTLFFLLLSHVIIHYLIGDLVNIKPLISIFEIFSVYYLVKESIKVKQNDTILLSIILSTSIGIILMFLAFFKGINLNDFEGDSRILINDALEIDLRNYRMSFFYTNFPFVISASVFVIIYFIEKVNRVIYKFILLLYILLICLALVASGNKTAMITTLIVFILSSFIFHGKAIYNKSHILYLLFFIPVLNLLVFNFYLNESNSELFAQRMMSSDSFEDRLGVYTNVFYIISENTSRILFGYGADFLTGAGEPTTSSKFKINYFTKNEQGAVDSGMLTSIIEFGFLYFFLFCIIIYRRIRFLYFNHNTYNILFLQIIFIFIISSLTQLVGLSKVFWFFVLIFALAKSNLTSKNLFKKNLNR